MRAALWKICLPVNWWQVLVTCEVIIACDKKLVGWCSQCILGGGVMVWSQSNIHGCFLSNILYFMTEIHVTNPK